MPWALNVKNSCPFERRIVKREAPNSSGSLYVRLCEQLSKRVQEAGTMEIHGVVF